MKRVICFSLLFMLALVCISSAENQDGVIMQNDAHKIWLSTDKVNFGRIDPNSQKNVTIQMANLGEKEFPLNLFNAWEMNEYFLVNGVERFNGKIAPGETVDVTFTFKAGKEGNEILDWYAFEEHNPEYWNCSHIWLQGCSYQDTSVTQKDNPDIEVNHWDFKSHEFGWTAPSYQHVVVYNKGAADLLIKASSSHEAYAIPIKAFNIAPSDSAIVPIIFTAQGDDNGPFFMGNETHFHYEAQLRLESNDPDEPITLVGLDAYVSDRWRRGKPNCVVAQWERTIEFGEVRIGSSKELPAQVYNLGSVPVDFKTTVADSEGVFSVNISQGQLLPGKKDKDDFLIRVRFEPREEKSYEGSLKIESNDPENPIYWIKLVGKGGAR